MHGAGKYQRTESNPGQGERMQARGIRWLRRGRTDKARIQAQLRTKRAAYATKHTQGMVVLTYATGLRRIAYFPEVEHRH